MPAATTKRQLQAITSKEYDRLHTLCLQIDEDIVIPKDDDDTSI